MPIVISAVLLSSVVFALAGMINAVFAKNFDQISFIPTFVLTPLTYLGGVFYTIKLLPEWAQGMSYGNPILYMVNAFRYGFLGVSDVDIRLRVHDDDRSCSRAVRRVRVAAAAGRRDAGVESALDPTLLLHRLLHQLLPVLDDLARVRDVFVRDYDCHQVTERQLARAALQVLALHMRVHARLLEHVHDHVCFDVIGGLVDLLHVVRSVALVARSVN